MDRLCDELQGLKEAVITLIGQQWPPTAGPHTRPQSSAELRDAVLADVRGMLDEELRQLRRELQELSVSRGDGDPGPLGRSTAGPSNPAVGGLCSHNNVRPHHQWQRPSLC